MASYRIALERGCLVDDKDRQCSVIWGHVCEERFIRQIPGCHGGVRASSSTVVVISAVRIEPKFVLLTNPSPHTQR